MQIQCESCGATVPADNISLENLLAKCASCAAVFPIRVDGGAAPQPQQQPPQQLTPPKGYVVDEAGPDLVVTKKWANPLFLLFVGVFALLLNGAAWTVYFLVADGAVWRWVLLPVQVLGLGALYMFFAVLVNSTTLRVARDRLTVSIGPLPMRGAVDLDATAIEQLYVTEQGRRGERTGSTIEQSHRVYYRLEARMRGGGHAVVLRAVADANEARFFERLIEQRLGMQDAAVAGEV